MKRNKTTLNARNVKLKAEQNENAAITYTVNYAAEIDTDTISTSTWSSEDSGVTIANEANTTTQASCRLSGDTGCYRVVNKIVTAGGDTLERFIDLRIRDNTKPSWSSVDYWLGWR
jgi:hypothetical protein